MPWTNITLNDGRVIPQIGFGTGTVNKSKPEDEVRGYVSTALELGFDHIDTAQAYGTEGAVGQALKDTDLSRSQIWITTKWSRDNFRPSEAIAQSLKFLGLSYVDLYLIHGPRLAKGDILGAWREVEDIQKSGLAKSIGVSNFTIDDLKEIESASIVPAVNQIELHAYNYTASLPLLAYAASRGIAIEAFSPLAPLTRYPGGPVDKPVGEIAERLGVEKEQVLLAWAKAKGVVVLTTTSKKDRLERYQASGDIELTPADIVAIDVAGAKGPPSFRPFRWRRFAAIFAGAVVVQFVLWKAVGWYSTRD